MVHRWSKMHDAGVPAPGLTKGASWTTVSAEDLRLTASAQKKAYGPGAVPEEHTDDGPWEFQRTKKPKAPALPAGKTPGPKKHLKPASSDGGSSTSSSEGLSRTWPPAGNRKILKGGGPRKRPYMLPNSPSGDLAFRLTDPAMTAEGVVAAFHDFRSEGNYLSTKLFSEVLFHVGRMIPRLASHTHATWAFQAMAQFEVYPDVDCYSSLIHALGNAGRGDEAISTYMEMGHEGLEPNAAIFFAALKACARSGLWEDARRLVLDMQDLEIDPGARGYALLCAAHDPNGPPEDCVAAYREYASREASGVPPKEAKWACEAAIRAHGRRGNWRAAEAVRVDMERDGVALDYITFGRLVGAAAASGRVDDARCVVSELHTLGMFLDPSSWQSIVDECVAAGHPEFATWVPEEMRSHGGGPGKNPSPARCYAAVVAACQAAGRWGDAESVFREMRAVGANPATHAMTFTELALGYASVGRPGDAIRLVDEMVADDLPPRADALLAITESLDAEAARGEGHWGDAARLIGLLRHGGAAEGSSDLKRAVDVIVQHAGRGDAPRIAMALQANNIVPPPEVFRAAIAEHLMSEDLESALAALTEVEASSLPAGLATYESVIIACVHDARWQDGATAACRSRDREGLELGPEARRAAALACEMYGDTINHGFFSSPGHPADAPIFHGGEPISPDGVTIGVPVSAPVDLQLPPATQPEVHAPPPSVAPEGAVWAGAAPEGGGRLAPARPPGIPARQEAAEGAEAGSTQPTAVSTVAQRVSELEHDLRGVQEEVSEWWGPASSAAANHAAAPAPPPPPAPCPRRVPPTARTVSDLEESRGVPSAARRSAPPDPPAASGAHTSLEPELAVGVPPLPAPAEEAVSSGEADGARLPPPPGGAGPFATEEPDDKLHGTTSRDFDGEPQPEVEALGDVNGARQANSCNEPAGDVAQGGDSEGEPEWQVNACYAEESSDDEPAGGAARHLDPTPREAYPPPMPRAKGVQELERVLQDVLPDSAPSAADATSATGMRRVPSSGRAPPKPLWYDLDEEEKRPGAASHPARECATEDEEEEQQLPPFIGYMCATDSSNEGDGSAEASCQGSPTCGRPGAPPPSRTTSTTVDELMPLVYPPPGSAAPPPSRTTSVDDPAVHTLAARGGGVKARAGGGSASDTRDAAMRRDPSLGAWAEQEGERGEGPTTVEMQQEEVELERLSFQEQRAAQAPPAVASHKKGPSPAMPVLGGSPASATDLPSSGNEAPPPAPLPASASAADTARGFEEGRRAGIADLLVADPRAAYARARAAAVAASAGAEDGHGPRACPAGKDAPDHAPGEDVGAAQMRSFEVEGRWSEAMSLYSDMRDRGEYVSPDAFAALAGSFPAAPGNYQGAVWAFEEMQRQVGRPDTAACHVALFRALRAGEQRGMIVAVTQREQRGSLVIRSRDFWVAGVEGLWVDGIGDCFAGMALNFYWEGQMRGLFQRETASEDPTLDISGLPPGAAKAAATTWLLSDGLGGRDAPRMGRSKPSRLQSSYSEPPQELRVVCAVHEEGGARSSMGAPRGLPASLRSVRDLFESMDLAVAAAPSGGSGTAALRLCSAGVAEVLWGGEGREHPPPPMAAHLIEALKCARHPLSIPAP